MSAALFSLAVKAVLVDGQGRTLLIHRSSHNRSFVGCWEWPGGKVDPGEDFAVAVVREAQEEVGLDIEITGLAGATQFAMPMLTVVLLCMEARITGGEIHLSEEHDAYDWVPLGELGARKLAGVMGDFMIAYAARRAGQK
jgi:8-oxo-dGTP diphosphatase